MIYHGTGQKSKNPPWGCLDCFSMEHCCGKHSSLSLSLTFHYILYDGPCIIMIYNVIKINIENKKLSFSAKPFVEIF
jgi:hypothetical protein